MATAYTDSLGFNKGDASYPAHNKPMSKLIVELDFAKIHAARASAGAPALAVGDSLDVFVFPKMAAVIAVGYTVVSGESTNTTATLALGTAAQPTLFAAAGVINNEGFSFTGANVPRLVSDGSALARLTIGTAVPTDAVVKVWAIVADCS